MILNTNPHRLSLDISGSIYRQFEEPTGERLVTGSGAGSIFFANGATVEINSWGNAHITDPAGTGFRTVSRHEATDLEDFARKLHTLSRDIEASV